jgi:hypothetical protein
MCLNRRSGLHGKRSEGCEGRSCLETSDGEPNLEQTRADLARKQIVPRPIKLDSMARVSKAPPAGKPFGVGVVVCRVLDHPV